MRPEPNKEIDLLLRQLSRRNGAPVYEADEQHLDADELNSYVANALPAAARARYTEHLADCSSCRKLVAQLSASQGPVAVPESTSVVAPSGWKSFLASLFSPMVLRYAVPALGLIVIAVFGIVVLLQERQGSSVARLADRDRSESVNANRPAQEATASPEVHNYDSSPAGKGNAQGPAAVAPVKKEDAVAAGKAAEPVGIAAAPRPAAPKAAVVAEEAPAPSADLHKQKKAEPAAQPTGVVDSAKDRTAETEKRKYQGETATVTVSPGQTARREMAIRPPKTADENTAAGAGRDFKRSAKSETDAAAETRSVAGRRFRKTDGGWIDVGYHSSQSITNVARGSEQYRALVADEPSIRTIAEELDGVVIVVWKGRTYRIR